MKKLLLIGLAVSGLAFVTAQRADAQSVCCWRNQFWISGWFLRLSNSLQLLPIRVLHATVLQLFSVEFVPLQRHRILLV